MLTANPDIFLFFMFAWKHNCDWLKQKIDRPGSAYHYFPSRFTRLLTHTIAKPTVNEKIGLHQYKYFNVLQ